MITSTFQGNKKAQQKHRASQRAKGDGIIPPPTPDFDQSIGQCEKGKTNRQLSTPVDAAWPIYLCFLDVKIIQIKGKNTNWNVNQENNSPGHPTTQQAT